MNLKQIDAAIRAYQGTLEEGDVARLDFFRELWGKLAEQAANGGVAEGSTETDGASDGVEPYVGAPASKRRTWSAAGEAVSSHAPASVDAAAFAAALDAACACVVEKGGFAEGVNEALARTKWDRIVAASSLDMAGSDPAAYLEDLADLLVDDGMTEDQARVGALVASLALRCQLEAPAQAVSQALGEAGCTEPHPLRCPVCGGAPSAARVGGQNSTQGRGKTLWCAQCGTTWEFDRVRCARCGTHNQGHLHYFNVEGDDAHRIATCEECGGYVRTTYADDALAPFSFEVEDVVMARLAAIAANPAYSGGVAAHS